MSARTNDVRKEVLMQLYGVRPVAVSVARITRDARKAGYDYASEEVRAEIEYLVSKGLAQARENPMGSEKLYQVTAAGVDAYEQGGLE